MKLLLPLFLLISVIATGQGLIKGKLQDSGSKQNLSLATITVFHAADTSIITYRLSDPSGDFRVPGIPLDVNVRMVISYSGYRGYRKEFILTKDQPQLDLGVIFLVNDPKSLEEVVIVAERPPVSVKNDTIEFNASAFKTLPNALVEDLLRKLPGVQVDKEGNITVNGRRVNRLLVDGKSFFGDDPKMATRNLPANVIDKVQVTPDKDEEQRNTDGDLSNIGSVINITLKKGVKKGWFGKVYAGAGTRDRYEAGGIANIYRDTLQLSLLGFSNNVNRSGFSMKDVQDLGGFNRSGYNSMMMMRNGGQQGFAINGISFGGLEPGIARSTGAGFNLNHAPNRNTNFFLQYFFGNNRSVLNDLNNTKQFINDTTIDTRVTNNSLKRANSHTVSLGANLKPDSLTNVRFRAGYTNTAANDAIANVISIVNNKTGMISSGIGDRFNKGNNHDVNEDFNLTRSFKGKKGRSLNISQYFNYRSNLTRNITESENRFYFPVLDTVMFDQLRRQEVPVMSVNGNINFSEPLSKNLTLRTGALFSLTKEEQDIIVYGKGGSTHYDKVNDALSAGFLRDHYRFGGSASLSYKIKKLTITAGLSAVAQDVKNSFRSVVYPVNQHLFNILPNFNINWNQLSINYNESFSPASTSNLIPVADISNPFFIRKGNPNLLPRHARSVNGHYYKFNPKSATNINFYINGQFINNDVISHRVIDANGVQTTTPVNADGSRNLNTSIGFGKEFKNKQQFIFSFRLGTWGSYNRTKLLVNNNSGYQTSMQFSPSAGFGLNWNDVVEIRPEYRISFSQTRYTDPAFTNLSIVTQNLETEVIVRTPKRVVWESNIWFRYNSQVAPGLPKNNLLWNAAVTYLFMKDQKGQLRLSIFDILNRNNNFYRYATQNYIIDNQTSVMQRFLSLTFTYNVRPMGTKGKVGGRERLFFF